VRETERCDAVAFALLADALSQVHAVEPLPVVAGAQSPALARLCGVAAAFPATGKHLLAVAGDAGEARAVIEMAAIVAGGPDALRRRPLVTLAASPVAAPAVAHVAAAAGVPCLIALSRDFLARCGDETAGGHRRPGAEGPAEERAPVADAGVVADLRTGLAESFAAGLAIAVDVLGRVPGAALGFALPPCPHASLDPRFPVALATSAQLSHSFGLPLLATALATQAPTPGWLASAENTMAAFACRLAGVDGLAGAGLLAGGDTVSLVELALDAEIASYSAATVAGVAVDDETLALETIKKVGIAGNYLGERHTRRHMRQVWRPRFYDRTPYEQWLREGRRQSADLAVDFVRTVLAEHTAPPLDAALTDQIAAIALRAGKEIP
jgi:trimethylamine--corrinoid protein Co-methyltransferase